MNPLKRYHVKVNNEHPVFDFFKYCAYILTFRLCDCLDKSKQHLNIFYENDSKFIIGIVQSEIFVKVKVSRRVPRTLTAWRLAPSRTTWF